MRVHEGDGHGLLGVQSALVSITAIHGVDHVRHLLTGVSDGILALLGELPDEPIKDRIIKDLVLQHHCTLHPHVGIHNRQEREEGMIREESFSSVVKDNFEETFRKYLQISGCDSEK